MAVALALPAGWVAVLEWNGQVAILPRCDLRIYDTDVVSDPDRRVTYRVQHYAPRL